LERLFPARTSRPDARAAELVEVADGEVEHFERGLLGRELAAGFDRPAVAGIERSMAFVTGMKVSASPVPSAARL
jgi:hypothetical protein